MKIDADEKDLLESVERGEWKSAAGGKRERTRYARYAKATFRKDRRLNIRLSSKDLEAIQKRALAEGLPYQTLIASLLHRVRVRAAQRDLDSGLLNRSSGVVQRILRHLGRPPMHPRRGRRGRHPGNSRRLTIRPGAGPEFDAAC